MTRLWRHGPGSLLVGALALLTGAFLMFPVIVVLPISFSSEAYLSFPPPGFSLRWYQTLFGSREWMDAMRTSFMIAIPTAILSVALGTAAAYGLVRGRFRGRRAIRLLVIAPMIVPNIIVAIGLYGVYSDLHVVGTALAVVLGHVVLATPLAVITITAALQGFDPMLERAALTLGAPPLTTFRRITLPLILPAILAGGVFAFSASFDELPGGAVRQRCLVTNAATSDVGAASARALAHDRRRLRRYPARIRRAARVSRAVPPRRQRRSAAGAGGPGRCPVNQCLTVRAERSGSRMSSSATAS